MRNESIDIMKAIGIILVIVGHNSEGLAFQYIYSFHMPMFFIISGYLWKERSFVKSVCHDFNRILVPYIIYFIALILLDCILDGVSCRKLLQDLLKIIWGSAVGVDVCGLHVNGVTYLWFLPALYICKNVFNSLYILWNKITHNTIRSSLLLCMSVFVCMCVGFFVHRRLFALPFAFTMGLNALGYFYIGFCIRSLFNSNLGNLWFGMVFGVIWLLTGKIGLNNMALCEYFRMKYAIIAGVTGTFTCYYLSSFLSYFNCFAKILSIIGQYTISILIIHHFVANYAGLIQIDNTNPILNVLLTMGIALIYVFVHYNISKKYVE